MTLEAISILLFFIIIILIVSTFTIQSKFKKVNLEFSSKNNSQKKTGYEVAVEILRRNNIHNVQVMTSPSDADYYDPRVNKIFLSKSVYGSSSIAAAAIAAHEAGHAIQWGKKEIGIKIRDTLAKPVGFISQVGNTLMSIGMMILFLTFFSNSSPAGAWILLGGVIAYGAATVFQFATLPVEFGASRKAMKQLEEMGFLESDEEKVGAKKLLRAAAMTYVIATLVSLALLLYFLVNLLIRLKNR